MKYDLGYRRGEPRLPSTKLAAVERYLENIPEGGVPFKAFKDAVKSFGAPLSEATNYLDTCIALKLVDVSDTTERRLFWRGKTQKK